MKETGTPDARARLRWRSCVRQLASELRGVRHLGIGAIAEEMRDVLPVADVGLLREVLVAAALPTPSTPAVTRVAEPSPEPT
jgi:hypothetical protein